MDFPLNVHILDMELIILYRRGSQVEVYEILMHFCHGDIFFILANRAGPDEMPHYVAFHLGLHCLPKYLFIDIQNEKG